MALLAEVLVQRGQIEEELTVLAEMLSEVDTHRLRFQEAELHRLMGELLQSRTHPTEEVEACFQQALELTRKQQAKSLELRAAISLARLVVVPGQA